MPRGDHDFRRLKFVSAIFVEGHPVTISAKCFPFTIGFRREIFFYPGSFSESSLDFNFPLIVNWVE